MNDHDAALHQINALYLAGQMTRPEYAAAVRNLREATRPEVP